MKTTKTICLLKPTSYDKPSGVDLESPKVEKFESRFEFFDNDQNEFHLCKIKDKQYIAWRPAKSDQYSFSPIMSRNKYTRTDSAANKPFFKAIKNFVKLTFKKYD